MNAPTRRRLLECFLASSAPLFIPARLLRGAGAPSNQVSLGVLGVGAQGRHDMRAFLNHDDVRVTALCDVNQRNIETAGKILAEKNGTPDAKVYSDFRQLHADSSVDAILMALPVHWHSIPAIDAILAGKHIYHEKPMAMSLEEGQRIRAAVKKKGVVFQFGTQQRSDMRFRWACELALNGRLGKIRQIEVAVPGGKHGPDLPEQPTPGWVNWGRWLGPAPATTFHTEKLNRDSHENITNFSLGMISCWGIHHLDIARWGHGTDLGGPASVEGTGVFPSKGAFDAITSWNVRFEYPDAPPILFANESPAAKHGIRFVGETGWAHVRRGTLDVSDQAILKDPQNKTGVMPIQLPVSKDHARNFLDAIKSGGRAICDVEAALSSDILCQIALIAVKQKRKLTWDAKKEEFVGDDAANAMLKQRAFRGEWKLPAV